MFPITAAAANRCYTWLRVIGLPFACQAERTRRSLGAALIVLAAACARTGLLPGDLDSKDLDSNGAGGDSSVEPVGTGGRLSKPLLDRDAGPDLEATAGGAQEPIEEPRLEDPRPEDARPEDPPACQPRAEVCNEADDDCDGAVDDLPGEACPGGGFSFCVAGHMSACPRRCEVCVPGSVRVCQNPYCTFWGEQECAADGQGFGGCREQDPPPECAAVAKKHQKSPELERCCLDNGYCCVDEHDLDHDGNRSEMLGACEDIACQ